MSAGNRRAERRAGTLGQARSAGTNRTRDDPVAERQRRAAAVGLAHHEAARCLLRDVERGVAVGG